MTRRDRLRAVSWRGEGAGPWPYVGLPPVGYERYGVTGTMRDTDRGPMLDTIVVRDTWTGASVTLRGATAIIEVMASESGESITGLWAAAHHIAADQARQLGRPPGATVTLAEIERARLRLAKQGIRPSRAALATETPCSPESVLRAVKRDGFRTVALWVGARELSTF